MCLLFRDTGGPYMGKTGTEPGAGDGIALGGTSHGLAGVHWQKSSPGREMGWKTGFVENLILKE